MSSEDSIRTSSGMTVIVRRVEYAPVAASVICYRVGSRNETEGIRGISHFIEHMMFKGTEGMPPARYWQLIKRAGGVSNAFTSRDMTAYYTVTPNRSLSEVLRIEADRMSGCLMDSREIASERQVVLEELRMTGRDSPVGALMDRLYLEAFERHPYRWPVAGTAEDVGSFSDELVMEHYRRYYRPKNAVLSVCGCVDSEEVKEMAERLFPVTEESLPIPSEPVAEHIPTGRRRVLMEHPSTLGRFAIAYRIPAGDDSNAALLKMLAIRLSSGRTGLLESALVEKGLAISASASSLGGIDPGLFIVSVTLAPDVDREEALEATEDAIARLASSPMDSDDVEALFERLRADALFASSNPAGRAIQLGMDQCRFGSIDRTEKLLRRAATTDRDELSEAAAGWLAPDRALVVSMVPSGKTGRIFPSAELPSEVPSSDISQPSIIDLEGLDVPDSLLVLPQRSISGGAVDHMLSCGARLVILEDHSFPTVGVSFCFPMGSESEPPELAGLTSVVAESMMRGTEKLGYRELHALLEDRGGHLELGGGREFSHGSASCLSSMVGTALEAVTELLTRPAFRPDDVARVISEKQAEIESKHESPFGLAADNLSLIMCQPREMARIPTAETLGGLDRDEVRRWHRLCCRPDGAIFVVVGDVEADSIAESLDRLLEGWRPPSAPQPEQSFGRVPDSPSSISRHMAGIEQAAVLLGLSAPDRFSSERDTMGLISWLLGGGIGSRLGHRVRDREGLAYQVGSAYLPWPSCGRLIVYLSTSGANVHRALGAAREELARIASEPVDQTELRLACANHVGRHSLERMDYGSVAHYLLVHLARGRGLCYDLESLRRTLAVEPKDLLDSASRWLGPDRPLFISRSGDVADEEGP